MSQRLKAISSFLVGETVLNFAIGFFCIHRNDHTIFFLPTINGVHPTGGFSHRTIPASQECAPLGRGVRSVQYVAEFSCQDFVKEFGINGCKEFDS